MESAQDRSKQTEGKEHRAKPRSDEAGQARKQIAAEALASPQPEAQALTDSRFASSANLGRKAKVMLGLQRSHGNAYVQRLMAQGSQTQQAEERQEVPPEVAEHLEAAWGGGQPLEPASRADMEDAFGQDFGDVRVHTDAGADDISRLLGAQAFTTGGDIFFRQGAYDVDTAQGKETLAHELTHVVQQGGKASTRLPQRVDVTEASGSAEREAQDVATGVALAPVGQARAALGEMVQSQTTFGVLARQRREGAGTEKKSAEQEKKTDEWKEKRHDAERYLESAERAIETKIIGWDTAFTIIGTVYYSAYKEHKLALQGSAEEAALKTEIAFGILSAMTAGSLGWLGEAAGKGVFGTKLTAYMFAGLEDAVQEASAQTFGIVAPQLAPISKDVGTDPKFFEANLHIALNDQTLSVKEFFGKLNTQMDELDLSKFETVEPKDLDAKLKQKLGRMNIMTAPKLHSAQYMADEYERDLWAAWVPQLRQAPEVIVVPIMGEGGIGVPHKGEFKGEGREVTYESPGTPVEARLNHLGITKMAGIGRNFGWFTAHWEIAKLVRWGRSYEPKKFEW